jgi:hypothetical protein|eukprot:COSAG01_NODE_197_length_22333_cov_45.774759_6_plen_58_part_00
MVSSAPRRLLYRPTYCASLPVYAVAKFISWPERLTLSYARMLEGRVRKSYVRYCDIL